MAFSELLDKLPTISQALAYLPTQLIPRQVLPPMPSLPTLDHVRRAAAYPFTRARLTDVCGTGDRQTVIDFFGAPHVTVVVQARTTNSGLAVNEFDVAAAHHLTQFLAGVGVDSELQLTKKDGSFTVDRPGVVVIASPKTSPTVAADVAADPFIRFRRQKAGRWAVEDVVLGTVWNSPADEGLTGSDVAYIARTPHGAGFYLTVAGIHAQGSLAAAHHLADAGVLRAYNDEYRGRRFSAVVSGDVTADPARPVSSRLEAVHG